MSESFHSVLVELLMDARRKKYDLEWGSGGRVGDIPNFVLSCAFIEILANPDLS